MDWTVPLCRPSFRQESLDDLLASYRSGWLTIGPETAALAQEFAEYTGAQHAVPVSSCSAGLHLAAIGTGLGPGDHVIVPSLTFTATVSAIVHVGAVPRFADVAGPTEPWLSAARVEEAIDERTKGIVTMSYGGHLGEVAELAELAERHGLVLIEDNAHAAGSRLRGHSAGTFGRVGSFSFSASKNIGIGEGGMLIADDPDLAARISQQSWHGLGSQAWSRHHQAAPRYELGMIGYNYRFDDPRAALVRSCLRHLDEDNRRRAEIDAFYRDAFAGSPLEPTAPPRPDETSSHCIFTGVLAAGLDRDRFRHELAGRGVQTTVHYPLLHLSGTHAQPGVRLPVSEDYARRCVTLPLFPQMTAQQQQLVVEATLEVLAELTGARAAA